MLGRFISAWAHFFIKYRILVLIAFPLIILTTIGPLKSIKIDNSNELFFIEGDENLTNFNKLLDRFGENDNVSIAFEATGTKDIFNKKTLEDIAKLTEFLDDHRHANKASSITTYKYMANKDDVLDTIDLIEDIEELDGSEENMDFLRNIMKKEKLAHDVLITKDFKHTIIFAKTKYISGESEHEVEISQELAKFLIDNGYYNNDNYKIHVFGSPIISEKIATIIENDSKTNNPIMAFVMMFILFASFRSVSAVLLPWLVIGATLTFTFGLLGALGWPLNTVSSALIGIMIIVGIGDSVHIIVEFFHFRNEGFDAKESSIKAMEALWRPCFYTSITTSCGFLALAVTNLVPIKQLGFLGAYGTMIAFLLSVIVLPVVLSFVSKIPASTKKVINDGYVTKFTSKLTDFNYHYRTPILIVGFVVIAVSLFLVKDISIDTNFVNYFKEKTTIRQDIKYFDEIFKGAGGVDIVIDSGSEGGVKEPKFLREVDRFINFVENFEETGIGNSIVLYIKKMNQSMHNDDEAFNVIPESRELVAQYLLLYENSSPDEDLSDLKTNDERYLRIRLNMKNMSADGVSDMVHRIKGVLNDEFSGLNVVLTGNLIMFNAIDIYVKQGIVASFGLALILIGLCFLFLFRSVQYGLLGLLPSVFPIIFAGGIMYLMDINLDLGTMIVAAMTMGIAVDDSVHVLNRYIQAKKAGNTVREAVHLALSESGRAVVFTSIILVCGFSVMLISSFIPMIYTGLFCAVILSMALLSDLIFLPALLFVFDKE